MSSIMLFPMISSIFSEISLHFLAIRQFLPQSLTQQLLSL